jgi:TetR/AcrR family transcriptional regulator, transcriptional repressor for nem operon
MYFEKVLTFYHLVDRLRPIMKKQDSYQRILDVAEHFTQTVGYNAFSYHDIAEKVGIKTSSIHYHFPTKADLGKAVVKKHIDGLCDELEMLINNKKLSYRKKLELFIDGIVAKTYLANRKMCLGGMLASDVLTLPETIQHEVRIFFNRLENWLKRLLTEAIEKNEFYVEKKHIKNEVVLLLSTLEGALLLARLFQDEEHLAIARRHIIARLTKG